MEKSTFAGNHKERKHRKYDEENETSHDRFLMQELLLKLY